MVHVSVQENLNAVIGLPENVIVVSHVKLVILILLDSFQTPKRCIYKSHL